MWLLRGLRPDFKTIADFRRDHPQALKGVCREFILLCKRLDFFGGELLAIDGSKFRAVNARGRSYTAARLAKLQRDMERMFARYLRDLERQDEAEAGTERPSADALREKIAALEQRRARYEDRLGANAAHPTRLGNRGRLQNRWHSRSEIRHSTRAGVDENDRHPDGLQVLLILEILIHRDKRRRTGPARVAAAPFASPAQPTPATVCTS